MLEQQDAAKGRHDGLTWVYADNVLPGVRYVVRDKTIYVDGHQTPDECAAALVDAFAELDQIAGGGTCQIVPFPSHRHRRRRPRRVLAWLGTVGTVAAASLFVSSEGANMGMSYVDRGGPLAPGHEPSSAGGLAAGGGVSVVEVSHRLPVWQPPSMPVAAQPAPPAAEPAGAGRQPSPDEIHAAQAAAANTVRPASPAAQIPTAAAAPPPAVLPAPALPAAPPAVAAQATPRV